MDPSRRVFLERAAHSSLVLGLARYLFDERQEPGSGPSSRPSSRPGRPALLDAALRRMHQEKKPGIVLRMHREPERQDQIVKALTRELESGIHPRTLELFAGTVIVCMESEAVDELVEGAISSDEAILIDPNGRRIDGATIENRPFVDALRELVNGTNNARLAERAKAARRGATPDQLLELDEFLDGRGKLESWTPARGLLARMGDSLAESEKNAPAALAESLASFESLLPILAYERVKTDSFAVRDRVAFVLGLYLRGFEEDAPGPVLPYGLELVHPSSFGCGIRKHGKRRSAGEMVCGAASLTVMSHRFVGILAK